MNSTFILFSLLTSLYSTSAKNSIKSNASEREYSSERYIRQNVHSSTTAEPKPSIHKVFLEDDWRPIIVQRNFQLKPSLTPKQRFSATMSKLRKLNSMGRFDQHGNSLNLSNLNTYADHISHFRTGAVFFNVVDPTPKVTVTTHFTTFSPHATQIGQKKKNKFLREDEIMYMQYSLATKPIPNFRQLPPSISEPKILISSAHSTDMKIEKKSFPLKEGRLEEPSTKVSQGSSSTNSVDIIPRTIPSRNIHGIIDKNNKDNFKPIKTTESTSVDDESSEKNLWGNIYSVFYKPKYELSIRGSSESTSLNSTANGFKVDSPVQHKRKQKVVKLSNKPIVITGTPLINGNYYTQLFDSFDSNPSKCNNCKSNSNITKTDGESANLIYNVTGIHLDDLVPETLKSNIFLVKRLFAECYSDAKKRHFNESTFKCLQKITFTVVDSAIGSDIVRISDTISLVKENRTDIPPSTGRSDSDEGSQGTNWVTTLIEKVQKLFSTHSLKIQLLNGQDNSNFQVEGRRRHAFRRVFPVVTAIYMTITAVLIPLVFQFMAMMGGKAFIVSKIAIIWALVSSFSRIFVAPTEGPHPHSPPPPHPIPYYPSHQALGRRRRHYRRVFPIMVGAYMILSTVLIPLGFKFMTLLGAKSLFLSKLSLLIVSMSGIKRLMGYGYEHPSAQPSAYPPYYSYPPYSSSYFDPWHRDEIRKMSQSLEVPTEYSHYIEELE